MFSGVFYDVLGEKVVDFQGGDQNAQEAGDWSWSCCRDCFWAWGSSEDGPGLEHEEDNSTYYSNGHELFCPVQHSAGDGCCDKKGQCSDGDPDGLVADESVDFVAEDVEPSDGEGHEAEPDDEPVGGHVLVVVVEVGKNAVLHVDGFSQVSDYQGGRVVEHVAHREAGPAGSQPPWGQTHRRHHESAAGQHPIHHADHCCCGCHYLASVEILVLGVEFHLNSCSFSLPFAHYKHQN